jgi:putative hemolysin
MADNLSTIIIIFTLIIVTGFFALCDYALAACRKQRLEKEKSSFYKSVLKALETPRFYSFSCRLYITALHIICGVLAAENLLYHFETIQSNFLAKALIFIAALFLLSLLSVLLGDTVPNLISGIAPEKISAAVLPFLKVFLLPLKLFGFFAAKFSVFFRPVSRLESNDQKMTEDDLRHALMEGEKSGVVESKERTMVEGVLYLGDRPVGAFMTHRSEIQWFDCNESYGEILEKALENRTQGCFPVVNGGPDEIIGAVYLEDIILDQSLPKPAGLRAIMRKPQFVPETMTALNAFESFRQGQANFLFVVDEYGGLAGIISVRALLEEIVGELSIPAHKEEPLVRRKDGTWLADGVINIDDAAKILSITGIPEERDFHTLAGFVLYLSEELPQPGGSFEYQGYRFIVREMDGNRIDKIEIQEIA